MEKTFILKTIIITICVIFILKCIPTDININHKHKFENRIDFHIKLSDPGYPFKLDVNHKGVK